MFMNYCCTLMITYRVTCWVKYDAGLRSWTLGQRWRCVDWWSLAQNVVTARAAICKWANPAYFPIPVYASPRSKSSVVGILQSWSGTSMAVNHEITGAKLSDPFGNTVIADQHVAPLRSHPHDRQCPEENVVLKGNINKLQVPVMEIM